MKGEGRRVKSEGRRVKSEGRREKQRRLSRDDAMTYYMAVQANTNTMLKHSREGYTARDGKSRRVTGRCESICLFYVQKGLYTRDMLI